MKKTIFSLILFMLLTTAYSIERTEPIDLYLIIDKSLSMAETDSFNNMQDWLCDEFLSKYVAVDDLVTIFVFYGDVDVAYSKQIESKDDLNILISLIRQQNADGPFTDIGSALDYSKKRMDLTPSNRMRVTLLCTDLIQEASYSSKYAGTYYDFASKYLASDRIIRHENADGNVWYEIAVRTMSDQSVADLAKNIYNTISASGNSRVYSVQ